MSLKIASAMTVCIGNICRSPVAEAALARSFPRLHTGSSGLGALVDHPADADAAKAAAAHGLDLSAHRARQFDPVRARRYDLILVMEAEQREDILRRAPDLGGRTFLVTHWTGGHAVSDPYRRSFDRHERAVTDILEGVAGWAARLDVAA
ncbi:low molecular weight phosphotyrosine protein phosphatase [Roseobacter sp. HKCCA0434]|uniref:arsenate reductase/protein-tyrosine-phosphatase family protein n=1 Tax=Roseobacter sp. HKCCA0434 TaxID=3079297 RepID=UPI002905C3B1|nr:low molecular weight phosphotyrosine protein phosphatase [Roseobacter sp. HKCCA0434]